MALLPNDLASVLRRSAKQLLDTFPQLAGMNSSDRGIQVSMVVHQNADFKTEIDTAVASDNSLGMLLDGLLSFCGSAQPTKVEYLSIALLNCVIGGADADDILAKFRAFAVSKTTDVDWYGIVAGVTLDEISDIDTDIQFVP